MMIRLNLVNEWTRRKMKEDRCFFCSSSLSLSLSLVPWFSFSVIINPTPCINNEERREKKERLEVGRLLFKICHSPFAVLFSLIHSWQCVCVCLSLSPFFFFLAQSVSNCYFLLLSWSFDLFNHCFHCLFSSIFPSLPSNSWAFFSQRNETKEYFSDESIPSIFPSNEGRER